MSFLFINSVCAFLFCVYSCFRVNLASCCLFQDEVKAGASKRKRSAAASVAACDDDDDDKDEAYVEEPEEEDEEEEEEREEKKTKKGKRKNAPTPAKSAPRSKGKRSKKAKADDVVSLDLTADRYRYIGPDGETVLILHLLISFSCSLSMYTICWIPRNTASGKLLRKRI